jgi:predicted Zn-dependent protease
MSLFFVIVLSVFISSCSLHPALFLPVVSDHRLETFVAEEAARILTVSDNGNPTTVYRFYLVDFPRKDILGLSLGENQIFLSYELTRRGFDQTGYLWLFRHTLAHEIAHHALRHGQNEHAASLNALPRSAAQISGRDLGLPPSISLRNDSRESELTADRKALDYSRQLGWDCRIWVAIFKSFLDEGYMGDVHHPTEERLIEALRSCHAAAHENFKKFAGEGAG